MNLMKESEKNEARKIRIREMLEAQEIALKYKNPRVCCMLARSGEDFLDLQNLQRTLIQTKDAKHCYLLAKHSSWADIEALQDVVIKYGTDYDVFAFAENVKRADVKKLARELVDRKNLRYLLKLTVKMPHKVDARYAQKLVETSNNMTDLLVFALNAEGADVNKLLDVVLKNKDDYISFKFAVEFPLVDIKRIERELIEWGSPVWCYKMVKHISGVNKEDLIQSIMLKHDLYYAKKCIPFAEGVQRLQLIYFVANSHNAEICRDAIANYELTEKEKNILLGGIREAEDFNRKVSDIQEVEKL